MTDKEALKLALEALKIARDQIVDPEYAPIGWSVSRLDEVLSIGKQALAAPVQDNSNYRLDPPGLDALYTTPPAAPVLEGRDWSLLEATQESLREHMAEIKRLKEAQPAPVQGWINPSDKTQRKFLPDIGDKVLFCNGNRVYYGHHTGGGFRTGQGAATKYFGTWDCYWMPIPLAHVITKGQP
jgi:hypothetical protein